ncbi:MAG: hypothetical protein UR60_C0006G0035 [Candidatus Moranbacteria bacterium GW2011_GWF2_34_56]|nr:MAG: hypothetical protein UR51_C0005G0039 [Candidatus Moranbacteria bacterium GW2011_GWF1_34_10]KKP65213.1 MAG: hypothetical protein UR60_C0006G0035 [Candidatus Moranbacteria bacterium GW2011_GWF2_34_56]HBI17664.1 hypothetical protein [Candidatus Moranbacteria bacterium]
MLDQKLLNKINLTYNLGGEVEFLSVVNKGFLSENYILKNKHKKFFLKKYRPFGLARLKEVHQVKKFFNNQKIPVIMPLKTESNKTFFKFKNNYFSLFPFIDKRQVDVNKINKKELESFVELLVKIHLLSKDNCPKLVKERGLSWDKKISLEKSINILNIIEKNKTKTAFDREVKKYLTKKIKLINENKIKYKDLGLKAITWFMEIFMRKTYFSIKMAKLWQFLIGKKLIHILECWKFLGLCGFFVFMTAIQVKDLKELKYFLESTMRLIL